MKLKAVLFDYDGTLADTTEENFIAWRWAFEPYHVQFSRRDYFLLEGLKIKLIAERLLEAGGADRALAAEIVQRREDYAKEHMTPKLFSQSLSLIADLKSKGLRTAMASAASRQRLMHPALSNLRNALDALISGDDCKVGKPNPEPYLMAAAALNLQASDCLVVENAPLGIQSAKAAGSYCIAITTTLSAHDLSEADLVLASLQDVVEWVKTNF